MRERGATEVPDTSILADLNIQVASPEVGLGLERPWAQCAKLILSIGRTIVVQGVHTHSHCVRV
jgi:hypothetical protein